MKVKSKKAKNSAKNSAAKKNAPVQPEEKKVRGNPEKTAPFRFQPGQSGNPAGRPKGKLNFDTRVDLAIEMLAHQFVDQFNKTNKKRIASGRLKPMTVDEVDIEGDIFRQYINRARNGDTKLLTDFLDRRHGKATQPVQIGSIAGDPLVEAQIKAAEAEVAAWEAQWESLGVRSGNKKHPVAAGKK